MGSRRGAAPAVLLLLLLAAAAGAQAAIGARAWGYKDASEARQAADELKKLVRGGGAAVEPAGAGSQSPAERPARLP